MFNTPYKLDKPRTGKWTCFSFKNSAELIQYKKKLKTPQKNTKLRMCKKEAVRLCMLYYIFVLNYMRTNTFATHNSHLYSKFGTSVVSAPNISQYRYAKLIVWFSEPYGIRTLDLSDLDSVNRLLSTTLTRGLVGKSVGTGPVSCTTWKFRLYRLFN